MKSKIYKSIILLSSLVIFHGCRFPGLEKSFLEVINLFQFLENRVNYSVTLEVTGLLGSNLILQNGSDSLTISSNGRYEFSRRLSRGEEYNVIVATQPTSPDQECQVFGGTGRIQSENITTIQVVCGDELVVVSGTVTGLVGSGLELTNTTNTGTFPISVGGTSFAFPPQAKNSTYDLSVTSQPTSPWQTCGITNPAVVTGTIPDTGLVIEVTCVTDNYPLTVQVIGIGAVGTLTAGNELEITEVNSAQVLQFTGDASASFPTNIASGSPYQFQIVNAGGVITTGICTIPSPTGLIQGSSNVVIVNCSNQMVVEGTVSTPGGSASSVLGSGLELTIQSIGGTPFTNQSVVLNAGQTSFSFPGTYPFGAEFQVIVSGQPASPNQVCTLTGTGTSGAVALTGNVSDVVVNCRLPNPDVITVTGEFSDTFGVSFIPPDVTGAEFRYTLGDGTAGQPDPVCGVTPNISTGLVPISSIAGNHIKILQCRTGWTQSAVITVGPYSLRVATPTSSIPSLTTLNENTPVNFTTATTGSTWFCYTTDVQPTIPADPGCGGTVNTCTSGINSGFSMPPINSRNVKVVGCRENFLDSNVLSLEYPIATYQISGTITGLTTPFGAGSFVLRNNGGDNLTISANGSFTFATPVASGANYNVTVFSQPSNPGQTCTPTLAVGTVTTANITNVVVNCAINIHTITGTVNGLLPGNTITISPGPAPALGGSFTLGSGDPISIVNIPSGTGVEFTIATQPTGQYCVVSNQNTNAILIDSNLTMDIDCQEGYLVGNQFQSLPPNRLDIHLYQGKIGDGPGSHTTTGAVDGPIGTSRFSGPRGIVNVKENLYLVDSGNHAIRRVQLSDASTSTFAGSMGLTGDIDDVGNAARLHSPWDLTTDGTFLYVTDAGNHKIKKIRISTGQVTTLAGTGSGGISDGVGTAAAFSTPQGIAYHADNLYVADTGNRRIRRINLLTSDVTTIAGDGFIGGNDGIGTGARLNNPTSLVYLNGYLYIADSELQTIRRFNLSDNSLTTVVGQTGFMGHRDGIGLQARLSGPNGIMTDGFDLYFTQSSVVESKRIRRVELPSFRVTTIAGQVQASSSLEAVGVRARFDTPSNLTTDGKQIFITDFHRGRALRNNELIFRYPLDGNLFAYGDRGSNLSVLGGATFNGVDRFGTVNRAIQFDGTTQYLTANDSDLPTGNQPRSLCAWAKPSSLPAFGNARVFASYGSTGTGQGFSIGIRGENGSSSVFVSGTNDTVIAYLTLNTSQWIHVCGIYDGLNASVYVNGKLMGKEAKTWSTILGGADSFQIGARSGANLFHGLVSDVRIYGRILNEGEIQDLAKHANSTEVGPSYSTHPSGLVLHYRLDGGLGAGKYSDNALSNYNVTWEVGTLSNVRGKDLRQGTGLNTRLGGLRLNLPSDLHALPFEAAPRTVCSWVKPEVLPKNDGDITPIFEYGTYNTDRLFSLVMAKVGTSDRIGVNIFGNLYTRQISLPLYTWSHVCASLNNSGEIRLFTNGSQVGSEFSVTSVNTFPVGQIRVGFTEDPIINYFPGRIDDIRIYDSALTVNEIRTLASPIESGVIARYDFRGDTLDVSGFGNHLTGNNLISIDSRWREPGSAYQFNGTNSRAFQTNLPATNVDDYSFSGWIRPNIIPTANSVIFVNGNTSSNGYGLFLQATTGRLAYIQGGVSTNATTVAIPSRVWTHIGLVKQLGTVRVYANGREIFTTAISNPNFPLTAFSIGSNQANLEHFNGDITDATLFNRALLPEEMVALSGYHPWQTTAWNPNIIMSSLIGHYQAESFDFLNNGDPITSWLDSSGKGSNLNTISAIPPTYEVGIFPNGSAVQFNQANSTFAQMDSGFQLDTANFTIFSVQRITQTDATNRYLLNYGSGMHSLQLSSDSFGSGYRMILCRNGDACADSLDLPAGTPFFSGFRKNMTNVTPFTNGNVLASASIINSLPGFGQVLRIGGTSVNTSFFNGEIGEILIFGNQLTGTVLPFGINERDYVDCYLSAKFGIRLDPLSTISCP